MRPWCLLARVTLFVRYIVLQRAKVEALETGLHVFLHNLQSTAGAGPGASAASPVEEAMPPESHATSPGNISGTISETHTDTRQHNDG